MTNIKKHLNILIVEDDLEIQENLLNTLSLIFKNAFTANDGIEALKILETNKIDIIITDYVMPNMNAYEFISILRQKGDTTPIIVLSSFIDIEKLQKCIPLNLVHFLEKPISFNKLIDEINKGIKKINFEYKICENSIYFPRKQLLKVDNQEIELSIYEHKLLELLCSYKNEIIEVEIIVNYIDPEYIDKNTVKNIVYRLRKKIPNINIIAHRNLGYSLEV